jgi:hypothetical protein
VCDRHELNRSYSQITQEWQVGDDRLKGSFWGEGTDMKFVNDQIGKRNALPPFIVPDEVMIDHCRRAMDAFGLTARGRIGPLAAPIDPVAIPSSWWSGCDGVPAVIANRLHWDRLEHRIEEDQFYSMRRWRPQGKSRCIIGTVDRTG